ncbi:type I methionyl aminopeptidase [Pseudactinotalea sp. HY158]|uniref:type I methionyl aminopeptidase n=1 Tax=Pseudactinotalea sp. HY158 TaxID=2654547 RepID=UPI00129D1D76|nr:type I methionyl aminopeptidase [Pseudactinotalea sp. HY158]QGH70407.1 type I methionyl aminopeptidase [Pseudactinotalea sp. HY158]
MFGRERIEYKSDDQVRVMRRAGLVVADLHAAVRSALQPGLTTADLDRIAAEVITRAGATSNFLGYHGFPGVICTSVNEEIVHGIPGGRELAAGDLVSIDAGAIVDGWHGDAAFSAIVPGAEPDPADAALIATTDQAMWAGIAATATATWLGEVSAAIDDASGDYGIVLDYTGHGIGSAMHQPPEVLNYRTNARGPKLRAGMCLAIEPMLSRASGESRVLEDEWTVVTVDGSRAAHSEHTVAIHAGGIWVLTAPDGGTGGLAPFGVVPVPLD